MRVVLDEGAFMPTRAHATDAGADLRTPVDVTVPAHGSVVIDTGVHVELPPRHAGIIKSKSGLNVKHGITSCGLIDEGYTGSIAVKLYNHSDKPVHLSHGSKVSQLVVAPVEYPSFEQVDALDETPRGDAGFGSTGEM